MIRRFQLALALLAVAGLAACAKGGDQRESGDTAAAQGEAMPGMKGMQGMSMDTSMMAEMQSHTRMMTGAGMDSMRAMLPMHRQMVANMISQMDREMRSMNMPASALWSALLDSLRQDNIRMPEMSATELQSFMPRHGARVMRLMQVHRSMMGGSGGAARNGGSDAAGSAATPRSDSDSTLVITVYKSPACGCCKSWVDHLTENGFRVVAIDTTDLDAVKRRHGVAAEHASCHTALVGGYVVEGHVPAADIRRLLAERPNVSGLAVPGMPVGSPGMEGLYRQAYKVLAFNRGGATTVFANH